MSDSGGWRALDATIAIDAQRRFVHNRAMKSLAMILACLALYSAQFAPRTGQSKSPDSPIQICLTADVAGLAPALAFRLPTRLAELLSQPLAMAKMVLTAVGRHFGPCGRFGQAAWPAYRLLSLQQRHVRLQI